MNILLAGLFLGFGFIFNPICWGDAEFSKTVKESTEKTEAGQESEMKIIQTFKGMFSGITQAKNVVINKKEDWENLWKEVHSMTIPLPPLPEIDFTKHTVLATFLGQKPTGGYTVTISKVVKKDKEILVYLENKEPSRDAITIQSLTAPYYMVVVPKIEDEKMIRWQEAPKTEDNKP
jgi:hypothetical protein